MVNKVENIVLQIARKNLATRTGFIVVVTSHFQGYHQ